MNVRFLLRLGAFAIFGLLVGCSSDDGGEGGPSTSTPTITSFSVSPTSVEHGESATLSWQTRGASRIVISTQSAEEILLDTTNEPNGILEVTPDITTTYVLRAISSEAEVSSEATVEVQPAIVDFATAAGDGPAVIGNLLVVEWQTVAAREVTLTNDEGYEESFEGIRAIQGWTEAPVSESGTFTLTARSGDLEVSETIQVDAIHMDAPSIVSFEADQLFIPEGEEISAEVSWEVEGASELSLFANGEPVDLSGLSLEADSVSLTLSETTNLVLVARNLAATVESELTIVVEPLPTVVSFDAFPARLPVGAGTTLAWVTSGAISVEIEQDGIPLGGEAGLATSGELEIEAIGADTTFLLRAFNRAEASVEETLIVAIGGPEIVSFVSARRNVAGSVPVDVEWEVLGGTQLTVLDPALVPVDGCLTIDVREIRRGSCQITSPEELGDYTYTLSVRDSLGEEVEADLTISVVDGPTIESFVASAERIEPGESVTLSWVNGSDPNGLIPSLSLVDDQGGSYTLLDKNALEDSIEIVPEGSGTFVFTLTASTPNTTPASASVSVLVEASATIVLSAPEEFNPAEEQSFELGWTVTDAASLTIWELDEDGQPIMPPLFETDDPDPSGSITVEPLQTVTYFAVVENQAGYPTEAEITVRVLGPEILSFVATPEDVLNFGFTTLTWTTENATSVSLDPPFNYSIRLGTEPYIDVAARETSSELSHEGNTCNGENTPGCPLLVFPEGFTFTYNGHTYDRANVFMSGLISFDLNRDNSTAPPSSTNQRLPVNPDGGTNETGWTEIIAPYWSRHLAIGSQASIHHELITDHPRGKFLAIEWKVLTLPDGRTNCNSPLGVNLILWEDGGFDFRYSQEETRTGDPNFMLCNGSSASIGFQHDQGQIGVQLSYNSAAEGGIANKSWSMFPATLGTNGMVEVLVPESQTFTLIADGVRGQQISQEVVVRTHESPSFLVLNTDPVSEKGREGEVPGVLGVDEQGSIEWRTHNVVSVEVRDADGAVVCQSGAADVPDGGCAVSFSTPGVHAFDVIGEDFMGNVVIREVAFDVRSEFRLTSFEVTPDELRIDNLGPATLSWEAVGANGFRVLVDGAEVPDLGITDPNDGSLELRPNETTTFVLELTSADDRIVTREFVVPVRTFETGTIGATKIVADGSESVTIDWETPLLSPGRPMVTLEPESFEMVEVMDSPFVDISVDGTELEGVKSTGTQAPRNDTKVVFPAGFTFPFFDDVADGVYPATTGYISLRPGSTSQAVQRMNYWSMNFEHVHIAPFHEWLRSHGVGTIYHKFFEHPTNPELDHQVIQWHRMQISNTSDGTDNLTFQAALYRDGSFEFRYGTMQSTQYPDRAGGSNAVAGFHEDFRDAATLAERYSPPWRAFELFFKPANPINLNGRTWRYQARKAADSYTFTPDETREYRVCFSHEGFKECKTLSVVVPSAGDLMITELFLDPEDGQAAQWFEVRNTTPHDIDLRGFTLASGSGSVEIAAEEPLVITPGQYMVFAASENPGLDPDYVYGTSFSMGPAEDTLTIRFKEREVAKAGWDLSWNVPRGRSLSLDPRWQKAHILSNDDPSRWCDAGETGNPRGRAVSCSSAHYDANPFATNYPFIDISQTGRQLETMFGNKTSANTALIPGGIGFNFSYFGVPVDTVWVSTHGFLAVSGARQPMPLAEPFPRPGSNAPGMIAPLWTAFQGDFPIYYERATVNGRQVLIVQWQKAVRNIGNTQLNYPGNVTFQAQLWSNGDIVLAYDDMSAIIHGRPGDLNPQQEHFGGVGTVGIESIGGDEGFMYLHQEPILRKGQSIVYINKSGQGGR